MSNELLNPRQQFRDDGGTALARGTIEFFNNGQEVVQKPIFSDSDLSVAQSNPYTLNDYGEIRGDVHYDGLATLVITNANGIRIRRLDDVVSTSAGDTNLITINQDSIADMVSDDTLGVGDVVKTAAYIRDTRVGGARYVIVAGGTGTVDGYLFHQLGNGLQAKLLDQEKNKNYLVAGARGDGGSDDTDAMQAVIDTGGDITVQGGFVFVGTNLFIRSSVRFVGDGTMQQLGNSSGDFLQIVGRVRRVAVDGPTLDGNQVNGNFENSTIGWVLESG